MSETDAVHVTTVVAVEPADAFDRFTEDVDVWWRRGPRHRFDPTRDAHEVRVLVWKPAERLVFEWRGVNFAPGEKTEVDVRFEKVAGGTRVVLEHRGWAALRRDHPARHGLEGGAFTSMVGLWWAELLTVFRSRAARRRELPGRFRERGVGPR